VIKRKKQLKPMDKPVYNYWTALVLSFYSSFLYIDVGKRWRGLGLRYLLLVMALLTIPYSIKAIGHFSREFEQNLMKPLSQIPPLYIQRGKISIDKPLPYLIKKEEDQVVVLIDPSGKTTGFTKEYPHLMVLITANQIQFLPASPLSFPKEIQDLSTRTPLIQTLDSSYNGVFSGKVIAQNKKIAHLKLFSQFMIYPLLLALFYSIGLVMFPVFAFLGQFFATVFFKFHLTFKESCRLLIVAATPMLLVLFIFLIINVTFPGMGLIELILLIVYFSFAIYSLKKENQLLTRA
jgi:hypothetical protein